MADFHASLDRALASASAPDSREQIAAVLAEHRMTGNWLNDSQLCRCGEWVVMGRYWERPVGDPFADHQADALLASGLIPDATTVEPDEVGCGYCGESLTANYTGSAAYHLPCAARVYGDAFDVEGDRRV